MYPQGCAPNHTTLASSKLAMKGFLVSTNSSKEINNPHWLSCVIILIGKSHFAILKIIILSFTWHRSLAMRVWWIIIIIIIIILRNKLAYFAQALLILFKVLALFSTFFSLLVILLYVCVWIRRFAFQNLAFCFFFFWQAFQLSPYKVHYWALFTYYSRDPQPLY